MNMNELLKQLKEAGVRVLRNGGNFDLKLPKDLDANLKIQLIANRVEFKEFLHATYNVNAISKHSYDREGALINCSFAQQRLWFFDQLQGETPEYNMPMPFEVKGELNLALLSKVFSEIIARHEVLRTVYVEDEQGPKQVVRSMSETQFKINEIDLSHLTGERLYNEVNSQVKSDIVAPFNLSNDVMLRVSYLHTSHHTGVLLFNMHHIASDAWSMEVLAKEFFTLYEAFSQGKPNPLPELEIQYADYAHWHRNYLVGEVLDKQLNYWMKQLDEVPPIHSLPLTYPRPEMKTHTGAIVRSSLSSDVSQRLQALAEKHQLTPFMLFHGALSLLISRHSNHTDVVIGTPVANRLQTEIEPLIGFFVNTLILRVDTDHHTLDDYFAHIRQTHLDAQSNQGLPFEQLVERLNIPRSTAYTPLFQIMLTTNTTYSIDNTDVYGKTLSGITFTPYQSDTVQAKFDLDIDISISDQGIGLNWTYDINLFDKASIERLDDHMRRLLTGLSEVANGDIPPYQLPLLSEQEEHQLVNALNDTAKDYPNDQCIHQLFEQQAQATPDNIAVIFEDSHLSYQQLNAQANQLAHYLNETQQITPDTLVGLCIERSIEMVVAILAIFKAGGAYVPLVPSLPQSRLQSLIGDNQIRTVITDTQSIDKLAAINTEAVALNDKSLMAKLNDYPTSNLPSTQSGVNQRHLAYVIFTSGSTGVPKGVMIEHMACINHCYAMIDNLCLDANCRIAQTAPLSFDISVWQILTLLLIGGQTVIIKDDTVKSPPDLINQLKEKQIAVLQIVPSLMNLVLDECEQTAEHFPWLKCVSVTGEACPIHLQQRWESVFPDIPLINAYGPAECADDVLLYSNINMQAQLAQDHAVKDNQQNSTVKSTMSVGKPISNLRVYIVDKHLQLVTFGGVGELLVAGDGLSRGYLNQAKMTASQFLELTIGGKKEKVYKTGDLVRYLANGDIEFIGRLDDQVKVRGFRIELGEVEKQLSDQKDVNSALVMAKMLAGSQQLVGYVKPSITLKDHEHGEFIAKLKNGVSNHLPNYMVPSVIIIMMEWPLTPNGKIDKKALPAPDSSALQGQYVAPKSEIEHSLVSIWAELLDIDADKLSTEANFFELGGHSLLSIRLVSSIRSHFAVDLPIQTVFNITTLAELANTIANHQGETVNATVDTIARDKDNYQASFAQQRLWFIDQLQGGTPEYNMPMAFNVEGQLSLSLLTAVFNHIIERHEVLRTVYIEVNGEAMQHIRPMSEIEFVIDDVDLSHLIGEAQLNQIKTHVETDIITPFDLAKDIMLRVSYLHTGNNSGVLLFNMHHIASDGWSIEVLTKEFFALYDALSLGKPNPLPALDIQYVDYAYWQRTHIEGEVLDKQLDYWIEQLSDVAPVHTLPLSHSRPESKAYVGAVLKDNLSADVSEKLQALAKQYQLTPFMLVHGALCLLLSRHSNSNDIVVGTPVANRMQVALEPLIGFFVNTLVLRVDTYHDSLSAYFAHIRQVHLGAQSNQDVPFEQLVERLNIPRSTAHTPLIQIMLTTNMDYEADNAELETMTLSDVTLTPYDSDIIQAKFDIDLNINISDNGVDVNWKYDVSLFDKAKIQRLNEHLCRLLTGLSEVTQGDINLHRLPMLSAQEKHYLIHQLNDTTADYPDDICLHQLFEQQVALTPDAPAVVNHSSTMSYIELEQRSNQLAHYMVEQGVKVGDLVPVSIPRVPDMIVALMAVLKTGAAYVPMDPKFPAQRKNYISAQANAPMVLTHSACHSDLDPQVAPLVILDSDIFAHCPVKALNLSYDANDLAYIIFTSGSTGLPKGVILQHRPVVNLINWVNKTYQVNEKDKVLFVTSISFDLSVYDIFGLLAAGGQIYLADEAECADPQLLTRIIETQQITYWDSAPAALNQITAFLPERGSESLRLVFLSGDWIPLSLPPKMRACYPNAQVVGLGGATEAAIWSNFFNIGEIAPHWASIPYGLPIENARYYVLDENLESCPDGVVGALYIGGQCLSRGYYGQPELTAERYLPDPYSPTPGGVLYTTGDLVRRMPDGNLEFMGRVDHQVKLRGYRIELGEIESVLKALSQAREVIALVRNDNDIQVLVAYIKMPKDKTLDAETLADDARRKLPDYMVPSHFVAIEQWPVTANGKLDRGALPAPKVDHDTSGYEAPQQGMEQELATLWENLLDVRPIGRHENFFTLGGHSLLAVQVSAYLRSEYQKEVPLRWLFDAPTVATFAQKLSEFDSLTDALVPLEKASRQGTLPLSYNQQRLWFINQLEGSSGQYNIPWAVQVEGVIDSEILAQAFNLVIDRHEIFKSVFVEKDGKSVMQLRQGCDITLLVEDHFGADEGLLAQIRREHAKAPFDLATGPLIAVKLLRISDNKSQLLINMHHIISDGWSMGILFNEFSQAYEQLLHGTKWQPKALDYQFVDFASWQHRHLQSDGFKTRLNDWVARLAQYPHVLALKTDHPYPQKRSNLGRMAGFDLGADITAQLNQIAIDHGTTLYATLISAFNVLLYTQSEQSQFLVGSPNGSRQFSEFEPVVGFFVDNLVLPCDLSAKPNFSELLTQNKSVILDAFNGQDIPFDMLVDQLKVEREVNRSSLFQVLFTLQNQPLKGIDIEGIELSLITGQTEYSNFDLALGVYESNDELNCAFQYSTELFDAKTIERLIKRFVGMIEQICHNPLVPFEQLTELGSNLHPNQMKMVLGQSFYPEENLYNINSSSEIFAEIYPQKMLQAIREVIADNDALHQVIAQIDGVYHLQPIPTEQVPVVYKDISNEDDPLAYMNHWIEQQCLYPHDMLRQPVKFCLMKLNDKHYCLNALIHHLFFDGVSSLKLLVKIDSYYHQLVESNQITDRQPSRYQDLVNEYQAYRNTKRYKKAQDYWQAILSQPIEPIRFYGKLPMRGCGKARRAQQLLGSISQQLQQQYDASLHDIMLGALITYLHRLNGQSRVSVGVALHNRSSQLSKNMLGLVMQIVPLVVDIEPTDTFADVLLKIQNGMRNCVKHGRYVLEVSEAGTYMDVLYNYHVASLSLLAGAKAQHTWSKPYKQIASLELQVISEDFSNEGAKVCNFDFREDVFSTQNQDKVLLHFDNLLRDLVARPELPVNLLSLLDDVHTQQLLAHFDTPLDIGELTGEQFGAEADFVALLNAQTQRSPNAIAIAYDGEQISYQQLWQKALSLSQLITAQGVEAGDIVPLMGDRGIDYIVAMVATMVCGGVYLPLNPTSPDQHQQQLLQNSQAALVLATDAHIERMSTLCEALNIKVLSAQQIETDADLRWQEAAHHPEHLAYVIFTSGSTGTPKGAMISRRSFMNHAQVMVNALQLTEKDVVAQNAQQTFDVSVWQMLVPLLVGARVEVIDDDLAKDPQALIQCTQQAGITILELVPAILKAMLDMQSQAQQASLTSLRWLIPTGEALPASLIELWFNYYPDIPMYNAYGPAECGDDISLAKLDKPVTDGNIPIGYPVNGAKVLVLDKQLQMLPVMVAGEIYIAGPVVGLGYLADPIRTAQSFLPCPYVDDGSRMYKTGDLGYFDDQGLLYTLGREDNQVKLRGQRLELGEIEKCLERFELIESCACILSADKQHIVCFYVSQSAIETSDLRAHCAAQLPQYMVPTFYQPLTQMPLSQNGKLDRHSLVKASANLASGSKTETKGEIETQLAQLWADLLGVDTIGRDDDFFATGGHSLLAAQLVARISKTFAVEVPLKVIFEKPVLMTMAEHIKAEQQQPTTKAVTAVDRTKPLPASFAQQRLWLVSQVDGDTTAYNITGGFKLSGQFALAPFKQALEYLTERHESLRTQLAQPEQDVIQVIDNELTLPFEYIEHNVDEAHCKAQLAAAKNHLFDLADGPLWQATLYRLGENEYWLNLIVHHVISDAWSMGILVHDFVHAYSAFVAKQQPQLPPLALQYADYATWQREKLSGQAKNRLLNYWQGQLSGIPAVHNLPLDGNRADAAKGHGQTIEFELDSELAANIRSYCDSNNVTLYMTLLAAYNTLVSRLSGQDIVVIGSSVGNRPDPALEQVIGFFVNTIALRVDMDNELSFSAVVERCREATFGALEHQDLPFDELVNTINPERIKGVNPLFQLFFVLNNTPTSDVEHQGLRIEHQPVEEQKSIFDLTLAADDRQDLITASFTYNTGLFNQATIERLISRFKRLLQAVVANPQLKVVDIELDEKVALPKMGRKRRR